MKYSFKSRIRYSETDKNTHLTFPAMMDYFQDTSTFHGEDNGLPLTYLYANNIAWVLSGWQVRMFKPAALNDIITFTTWAYAFKRSIGLRHYTMTDENGMLCAIADTQYVLIDTQKQLPTRIPEELANGYAIEHDAHIDIGLSRKIHIIPEEENLEPFAVREYMIDTNNHVNNSQYIKTALSYVSKELNFNCFRAEYKKQARLGHTLYPFRSTFENGVQIKLYDEAHDPYFIGEWSYDPSQTGDAYAANR